MCSLNKKTLYHFKLQYIVLLPSNLQPGKHWAIGPLCPPQFMAASLASHHFVFLSITPSSIFAVIPPS